MIELTRLGQQQPFLLNPDLIERIDAHVDSVIRLTNGVEYVVTESADEIVDRIVRFRLRTVANGPVIARPAPESSRADRRPSPDESPREHEDAVVVELPANRPAQPEDSR